MKVSGSSSRATSTNSGTVYTVKAGDSLSSIAAKYGTTYQKIMQLNGLNNYLIFPGQKLKVSGKATSSVVQKLVGLVVVLQHILLSMETHYLQLLVNMGQRIKKLCN